MMSTDLPDDTPRLKLADIETTWRRQHDPLRFTLVYGPAIHRYLVVLLLKYNLDQDADDVLQEILTQVTEQGFPSYDPSRGSFRPYLKQVVRNAATRRAREAARLASRERSDELDGLDSGDSEKGWVDDWRACVLEQALRALERHEREAGRGNLAYTVIRLSIDHPDADSRQLAALVSRQSSHTLTPEAFRKQMSRARRTFAELIVAEVRQTLDCASGEQVVDELAELGLLGLVREFLPKDASREG